MQPLSRGEGRRQEGARLDIFAKCGILFLFILTGLPGAAGPQKEMSSMKYAFDNANLLDGTKDMRVQPGLCVLTDGGTITDIVPAGTAPAGYTRIDLRGRYLLPGLINMHVHLAGSGKIQKKQRDNEKLVRRILSNPVSRAVAYRMVCGFARDELLGGVTTIRTVGGLSTFDTRLRDEIAVGRRVGPRILAANEGISVPGGHMAGSVAIAAGTIDQALAQVDAVHAQGADLVKLMITGGVMDATERGVPGELKMPPEMVRAVCERAHALGYTVAAHTESPEGVRVALENGADSIEHGAKPDEEILRLFHERGAFLCVTLSPALPYALFDRSVTHLTEVEQFNGNVVFRGHGRVREGRAGARHSHRARQRRRLPVDRAVRLLARAVLLPQVHRCVQCLRALLRHRAGRATGGAWRRDRHARPRHERGHDRRGRKPARRSARAAHARYGRRARPGHRPAEGPAQRPARRRARSPARLSGTLRNQVML